MKNSSTKRLFPAVCAVPSPVLFDNNQQSEHSACGDWFKLIFSSFYAISNQTDLFWWTVEYLAVVMIIPTVEVAARWAVDRISGNDWLCVWVWLVFASPPPATCGTPEWTMKMYSRHPELLIPFCSDDRPQWLWMTDSLYRSMARTNGYGSLCTQPTRLIIIAMDRRTVAQSSNKTLPAATKYRWAIYSGSVGILESHGRGRVDTNYCRLLWWPETTEH